ncbi:MAG: YkgJ family cysteine cluster protein [Thermodesulfobacteriota bacterium]
MTEEQDIFQCRQCGHCCQGETTVSLNERDLERLVRHLRRPRQEVIDRYLRVTGNVVQMKIVDGHCIFYTREGCLVHPGKPWRCRQWPLHESILSDEANFSAIKDSCPGISRTVTYEQFCAQLRQIHAAADYERDAT